MISLYVSFNTNTDYSELHMKTQKVPVLFPKGITPFQIYFDNHFACYTLNLNIIGLEYPHFYYDNRNYINLLIAFSFPL